MIETDVLELKKQADHAKQRHAEAIQRLEQVQYQVEHWSQEEQHLRSLLETKCAEFRAEVALNPKRIDA